MGTGERGRLIAGRYRLEAVVGRGGMGLVWQARDELLCREVAVKEILWPASCTEQEWRGTCRRAVREARLAGWINHHNVIRVFDIVEEQDCPWIVMEFVPCRSLHGVVQSQGPLTPAEAGWVGLGVLAALRAVHEQGIVHRDVKPANILVAPDRVVLTDFGIARLAGTPAKNAAGLIVGTAGYLAPERARGGESGPADDLWGLGASLYTAVEGHAPFERNGDLATMTAVVADEPAPPAHAGELWPVISGLLRKEPGERLDAAATERMLLDVCAGPLAPGPVPVTEVVPVIVPPGPAVPIGPAAPVGQLARRPHRLVAAATRPEAPVRPEPPAPGHRRPARGRHSANRKSLASVRNHQKQQPERMRLLFTLAMTVFTGERVA